MDLEQVRRLSPSRDPSEPDDHVADAVLKPIARQMEHSASFTVESWSEKTFVSAQSLAEPPRHLLTKGAPSALWIVFNPRNLSTPRRPIAEVSVTSGEDTETVDVALHATGRALKGNDALVAGNSAVASLDRRDRGYSQHAADDAKEAGAGERQERVEEHRGWVRQVTLLMPKEGEKPIRLSSQRSANHSPPVCRRSCGGVALLGLQRAECRAAIGRDCHAAIKLAPKLHDFSGRKTKIRCSDNSVVGTANDKISPGLTRAHSPSVRSSILRSARRW
ncbi:hypothetical protein BDZ90DRAFT_87650 [Jaminaea rosea]|uniref:Uncharacterized protein n=1 Tax=Jaminaea rosea TaxID=1569628 RepID=A0A316UNX2_9BASI|nr:hypothetical protein BDZ90DRAFT_87650 [Jaminaea rosea]PWN24865.1 hypothetical protein BDZ90DRAFT_87650 [Jaminaea rosea]